jgi:hypothetical protein
MAKKKAQRGQVKPKRRFAAKPASKKEEKVEVPLGFFQRLKDVLPDQKKETVRVKTFIVEKPVYVQAPDQRILPPAQKYQMDKDEEKFDSRRSRYLKRKQMEKDLEEDNSDELEEPMPLKKGKKQVEEDFAEEEAPIEGEEELAQGEEGMGEEPLEGEEGIEGEEGLEGEEGMEEVPEVKVASHTRSRSMFNGVWWWRAIFWAFLIWLIILLIELGMQSLKLVEVDLTRGWWIVLCGLVVVMMIYFKIFDKPKKS